MICEQLPLFARTKTEGRFVAPAPRDNIERAIDHALGCVGKQAVLHRLLDGKPWAEAFGIGGYAGRDIAYFGDSKGLKVEVEGGETVLVKPKRIMERVAMYRRVQ